MTSYDFIPVAERTRPHGKAGAPVIMNRVREVEVPAKHSSPLAKVAKRILLGTSEEEKSEPLTAKAPKRNHHNRR